MSRRGFFFFLLFAIIVISTSYIFITLRLPIKNLQRLPQIDCPPNCNVILISVDTLRADHLGIYGYEKQTSPNIDQFAKDAMVFENAFAQSSWTLPSYTSMLTGFYPQELDVEVISDRLPQDKSTIAEILKNAEYKTAAFTSGAFVNEDHGFSRGFDQFEESPDWQDASYLTDQAMSFLSKNQQEKFFLFLHYFHVHDPYNPSEDNAQKFDPEYIGNIKSFNISEIVKLNTKTMRLSQEDLQYIKALYDAEIFELDNQLARVFQFLKDQHLDEDTIIIINSDHGEEFGERGIWGMHAYSLYDELLHIPLIIKVPSIQGKRVDSLVENRDIPKTLIELLELEDQVSLPGQNLIKIASGETGQNQIYAETTIQKQQMLENIDKGFSVQKISDLSSEVLAVLTAQKQDKIKTQMVRTKEFKLIKNFDGEIELYNLNDDPEEKTNLAGQGLKEETGLLEKLKDY